MRSRGDGVWRKFLVIIVRDRERETEDTSCLPYMMLSEENKLREYVLSVSPAATARRWVGL